MIVDEPRQVVDIVDDFLTLIDVNDFNSIVVCTQTEAYYHLVNLHQLQIALDGELEIGFIVRIDQDEGIFADELGEFLYGPSPNTLIEEQHLRVIPACDENVLPLLEVESIDELAGVPVLQLLVEPVLPAAFLELRRVLFLFPLMLFVPIRRIRQSQFWDEPVEIIISVCHASCASFQHDCGAAAHEAPSPAP